MTIELTDDELAALEFARLSTINLLKPVRLDPVCYPYLTELDSIWRKIQ